MKDFKLRGAENLVKKRSNRKLKQKTIDTVKEKGTVDTPEEYLTITDPKKKKNHVSETQIELKDMKENNNLGVPNSFYELTPQEQSFLMFYLSSDFVHPILEKHTHMNLLMSYVTTFLDEDEIYKIWKFEPVYDEDGNLLYKKKKIKNSEKYKDTKLKSMAMFQQNPNIKKAWNDMVEMNFGADPKDMIKNAILDDALYSESSKEKIDNRKMAIDILGMKEDKSNETVVNVFTDGGGSELVEMVQEVSNDDMLTTKKDLEVDDD